MVFDKEAAWKQMDDIRNSAERKAKRERDTIEERIKRQIIRIFPSSDAIPFEALQLAKEGIEQYMLNPLQLKIPFSFEKPIPEVTDLLNDGSRIYSLQQQTEIIALLDPNECESPGYRVLIIDKDFIYSENKEDYYRIAGFAHDGRNARILIRPLTIGRILDGVVQDCDKREYFKAVVGHEAYHMLGAMPDLDPGHASDGIKFPEDDKQCLGYSHFHMPPKLCKYCAQAIHDKFVTIDKDCKTNFTGGKTPKFY